jgi:hypothetical protein
MASMTEALEEAYAAAPAAQIVLSTLEIRHATFAAPVRLLRDYGDLIQEGVGDLPDVWGKMLTLESDAPVNPNTSVLFQSCMFQFKLPEQQESRLTGLEIVIDNATQILSQHLDNMVTVREPVHVIYREYFADDPTTPQFIINNMILTNISSNTFHVKGLAEFADLVNRKFPNKVYRPDEYKGLSLS